MRAAGLTVIPGESHDGLFHMLGAGRFDAFSRGVAEIIPDYERASRLVPGLAIEPHLLLHYPLPLYFWFAPDEAGRHRAARVEAGLREMLADGTLQKMYGEEYAALTVRLNLAQRQVIELPNPQLDGRDHLDDTLLWGRPQ
jgi:ABC-type amino acid transport substrate-binding protein